MTPELATAIGSVLGALAVGILSWAEVQRRRAHAAEEVRSNRIAEELQAKLDEKRPRAHGDVTAQFRRLEEAIPDEATQLLNQLWREFCEFRKESARAQRILADLNLFVSEIQVAIRLVTTREQLDEVRRELANRQRNIEDEVERLRRRRKDSDKP